MSALSSGKTNKYEYLTGEEILPSNKSRMLESGEISKTSFSKTKSIKNKKQVEAIKVLKPAEHQQKLKIIEEIFPKESENLGSI